MILADGSCNLWTNFKSRQWFLSSRLLNTLPSTRTRFSAAWYRQSCPAFTPWCRSVPRRQAHLLLAWLVAPEHSCRHFPCPVLPLHPASSLGRCGDKQQLLRQSQTTFDPTCSWREEYTTGLLTTHHPLSTTGLTLPGWHSQCRILHQRCLSEDAC